MILTGRDDISIEELVALSYEIGFSHAAPLAMDALEFREDVRAMCSEDKCHSYGRSWSCPPAAGTLESVRSRASSYSRGIIVQTCGSMDGDFDLDSIHEVSRAHKSNFDALVRQVRTIFPGCLPMGAGACTICRRCTYPGRPCRHPSRMYPSMEAYGLWVSDVCLRSGIEYNYGPHTMTYTSCILIG